jgi:hypothetical protein
MLDGMPPLGDALPTNHQTRWEITAQHGGGYVYQLCPLGSKLTEECFASNRLDFAQPYVIGITL